MKTTTIILMILFCSIIDLYAQTPESFKYQAVVRSGGGTVLANQAVGFQLSILQTSETGTSVYTETFTTTTNSYGLVNLLIGEGTPINGDFTTIDWGAETYFLKVEIDETGGASYVFIGTSKLNSVPYALHAKNTEKIQGKNISINTPSSGQVLKWNGTEWAPADDDVTGGSGVDGVVNSASFSGTNNKTLTLGRSNGLTALTTNFTDEVNDADADTTNELQVISFLNDTLYLTNGGQVYMGVYGNLWASHGNDIYNTNTRNIGVGLEDPKGKLVVQGDTAVSDTLPLFEVKNKDGQTIFAVYDGGVRVYVRDEGGMYANNDKSGFAIGGYRLDKSITNEYLRVTPDSVRVYIKEENTNKANNKKGGFAIGGYRLDKTTSEEYLNVYVTDTAYVIDTTAQMLWYPLKEAFLSGKILVENGDSIGQNSWATGYVSKSIGDYSQALGYQARAFGNNSTAIGYYANAIGNNSYAFGNYSTAIDSGSYAIGSGAKATGLRSFAIGSDGVDSAGLATNPTIAIGDYSYAFGMGCVANDIGSFAFGTQDSASGSYSLAMGYKSVANSSNAIAIGNNAYAGGFYGFGSTAIGMYPSATGFSSVSIGRGTRAIGSYSLAMGRNTEASGLTSTVFGYATTASGDYSTAMGNTSTASGDYSTAIGSNCIASDDWSFAQGKGCSADDISTIAMGSNSHATQNYAVAIGASNNSSGYSSVSLGQSNTASGYYSLAMGLGNSSTGVRSFASGSYVTAQSYNSFVFGRYNIVSGTTNSWIDTEALFVIGNGSSTSSRSNAMTIIKNGNVGIGTAYPGNHRLSVESSNPGVSGSTVYVKNSSSSGLAMIIENSNLASSDNVFLVSTKGTGDIVRFDSYHGNNTWDDEFRFDNDGDGYCDKAWHGGGADYAEYFPKADTSIAYEPGDIIMISPNKTYTVDGANKENANLLVGVYSNNPAMVGNSPAEDLSHNNDILVGLMGVINTKVNKENGSIKIGDYITISSTPKIGMKATKNGMVVGRAMDNFDGEGIGKINVLVEVDWYYNTEDGDITSSEIKNTFKKQQDEINILKNKQKDIDILKAEIEQLKQILEVKAQK